MASKKKKGGAYVVVRLGWFERYGADRSFGPVQPEDERRTLGRPVALFLDEAKAKGRRDELERADRAELNPFLFVGGEDYQLEDVTSLSPEMFTRRMKLIAPGCAGPETNEDGELDWVGWWEAHADGLGEQQRQAVWEALDRLRLYAVMPVEVEE